MQKKMRKVYSVMVAVLLLVGFTTAASFAESVQKIDINSATAKELQLLKGVGEKIAERIVKFREESGSFKTIEEIKKVKGIGEKTFEKISPYIYVDMEQPGMTESS